MVTNEQKESRLAALRQQYGHTDDDLLTMVKNGKLPNNPDYGEWLILLGKQHLLLDRISATIALAIDQTGESLKEVGENVGGVMDRATSLAGTGVSPKEYLKATLLFQGINWLESGDLERFDVPGKSVGSIDPETVRISDNNQELVYTLQTKASLDFIQVNIDTREYEKGADSPD